MSVIRVLICDRISDEGVAMLSNASFEVTYNPKITAEELIQNIPRYDVLIVRSRTKISRDIITAGTRLKVIGRAGVGLDNVDLNAANEVGITVYNTPDALANAVAELIIGFMLTLSRGICRGNVSLKAGEWLKNTLIGGELRGKTLGVIGMGRIGRRVAELAGAFGMHIIYHDVIKISPEVVKRLDLHFKDLDTLLAESDFLTLHIPLTPETYHYIDQSKLVKMKRSAYLINASRGAVVDEESLLDALKSARIRGAALDVFENEPPGYSELVVSSNVICTPHVGAQTVEAQKIAATGIAEKIIEHFKIVDNV
jgi:D-3-phosphoglycerate dehydrogenase